MKGIREKEENVKKRKERGKMNVKRGRNKGN